MSAPARAVGTATTALSVVTVSNAVPGRVRLRVIRAPGRAALITSLADRLAAAQGIREVRANPVTGSLLVLFDPGRLDHRALLIAARRHARASAGNGHVPGPATTHWPTAAVSEVVADLATSVDSGLSTQVAAERLALAGPNRLPVPRPKPAASILAGHLTSLPVLMLGGAAVLSVAGGAVLEAAVIVAVVAANAAVGFVTERRVERILTSLQNASIPQAVVRRDGQETILPAAALVAGDLLVLKAGHDVPADARVVATDGLAADESTLTGESAPVPKQAAALPLARGSLAERCTMVHAGTVVAEGSGLAVVTATGARTELGRIRALVAAAAAPPTPLERQLGQTGRRLVGLSLAACAAAAGLGVLRGVPILEMARTAISLAVAAVPEGLPAVATTTLALGMRRMMLGGTLVRRLAAVEGLGAVTVICADKTGTVTENRMTVDAWCIGRREYGQGAELMGERELDPALGRALSIAVLCSEAELATNGEEQGSATETALLVAARAGGIDCIEERQRFPRRAMRRRLDGDSWMATVHAAAGADLVMVKGAPEQVLARADRWIDDGVETPLTPAARRELLTTNERVAARGLRVLALAYREIPKASEPLYEGLVWVGLVALTDPIRPGVGDAIRACRAAGIRTVLITGDHARTAAAIYRELGLGNGQPRVFDASHVGELSPDRLQRLVRDTDVFARVSPIDKHSIVRALQAGGDVVAMTGDGVNDAAALRAADVGVAMGARGTDIARDVADVVLLSDDFGGIVTAVEQGRAVHANIGRALRFLLATNFSEILVTLGALAIGGTSPMSAMQFLWINLLSDVAPALALGMEPAEADAMARPPRDAAAPMLSRHALAGVAVDAGALAATTLGVHAFAARRYGAGARATTLAFSTLTTAQLLHALTYRSRRGDGVRRLASPLLAGVVGGSIALQAAALAVPPLRRVLGLTPLPLGDWALAAGAAALPLLVRETGALGRRDHRTRTTPMGGQTHGNARANGF
jgi:P-type Ca2+ transporter type 2C